VDSAISSSGFLKGSDCQCKKKTLGRKVTSFDSGHRLLKGVSSIEKAIRVSSIGKAYKSLL